MPELSPAVIECELGIVLGEEYVVSSFDHIIIILAASLLPQRLVVATSESGYFMIDPRPPLLTRSNLSRYFPNELRAGVVVVYNMLPESNSSLLVAYERVLTGVKPSTNKDPILFG